MYPPRSFQENRPDILHAFIEAHPLGSLIVQSAHGPDAFHLPFLLGVSGTLQAHVACSNPVWQNTAAHENVLVIFQGGEAYVSPDWYPSKQQDHRQVPTWNYEVVHARGRLTVHDDEHYLRELLARLTQKHEAGRPKPWEMNDAPQEYIDALIKATVGIEIEITSLTGIMKLDQNQSLADRMGAAENLIKSGNLAIGEAMLAAVGATG